MKQWIENPKQNPPPNEVLVEVRGTDFMGEWTTVAMRKDYKPGSTKKQLKRGWRWLDAGGSIFDDYIEAWRPL